MIFTADNGGDTHGNNFPLRGGKFTTWDGGLRVVGAVNGGILPKACRGEVADGFIHIPIGTRLSPAWPGLRSMSPALDA